MPSFASQKKSLLDEALNQVEEEESSSPQVASIDPGSEEEGDLPSVSPKTELEVEAETRALGRVKGTFAGTLAPKVSPPTRKSLLEEALDLIHTEETGSPRAKTVVVHEEDPAKIKALTSRPKSLLEEAEALAGAPPTSLNGDQPGFFKKTGESLLGLGRPLLTALSIDEHLMVKGISKAMGDPDLPNLDDYTWTNFIKKRGAPDSTMTDALGFAMSVFLSPSMYLSFGSTGVLKISGKMGEAATLTRRGQKLVNELILDRVEKKTAQKAAQIGRELTDAEINQIAAKTRQSITEQVVGKFKAIQGEGKQIKSTQAIRELPESIFDYGGINLSVPLVGEGLGYLPKVNLVSGPEVAKIAADTGLVKLTQMTSKVGESLQASDFGQALSKHLITPAQEGITQLKDAFGKTFIPDYGKPAEILNLIEETRVQGERIKLRHEKRVSQLLGHLSGDEQRDFMESAIQASIRSPGAKVEVTSLSKSPAVQEALDRFYAQGRFKGRKSIADELADRSELLGDERLATWIPGIREDVTLGSLDAPTVFKPGDRSFLKSRIPSPETYTRDPIQALSVRMTQISFAKLQDKMVEKATKMKLGGMLNFGEYSKLADAEKAEYVAFRSPLSQYLIGTKDLAERSKETLFFAKADFVREFEDAITKKQTRIPFLSAANNILKSSLTVTFPSFFARNMRSNLIFNSYSIGAQAVNPKRNLLAIDIVRGTNLDQKISTEIGEKFKLKDLLDEARIHGVITGKDMFFDLAGETLSHEAKNHWEWLMTRANPLSPEFLPFAVGHRFNSAIENQARMVNYMTWRMRGATPRMAAMEAKEALLDYSKISGFEKKWANLLIPFYSFQRLNMEKHLKLLAHRPAFTAGYLKVLRDFGPTDQEWDQLPEWAKNKSYVRFNGTLIGGWGLPIEDMVDNLDIDARKVASKINPMLRLLGERVAGKDFYSNRNLESVNAANEFRFIVEQAENQKAHPIVRDIAKRISTQLGLKRDSSNPEKIIGDPFLLHVGRNMMTARWQSTLGLIQREDKSKLETLMQYALGFIRLTPDEEKKVAYERQIAGQKLRKEFVSRGVGVEIPYVIAKDPMNSKYINQIFSDLRKAVSTQEVRGITQEGTDLARDLEKEILP